MTPRAAGWVVAAALLGGGGSGGGRATAAPHAFSFEDMVRLAKVSDPQISADERVAFFTIARARPDLNRWQSAVYMQLLPQSGQPMTPAIQLTFPERGPKQEGQDFAPRLAPDGQRLAFLSTRDGAAPQLYLMTVGGGEARKLTNLPGGVASLLWTPDSRALVIQARVVEGCPPYPAGEECNRHRSEAMEKNSVRARLIDRLMYRHWDDWYDGRRSHLLRVLVPDAAGPVSPPLDLTPGDWDTPPVARAGHQPYAVSPDGKELAYVQNRDKDIAVSTNNDIWVVPLGRDYVPAGQPRNLTSKNLATDVSPRYSPDGHFLAYLAQKRAGFEGDKFELKVYDRVTGQNRSLTETFDHNAGEPVWSPDSQRLYFLSSLKGRGTLNSVDISGKNPVVELNAGDAHELALHRGPDGLSLYFLRGALSHPPELYRLDLDASGKAAAPPLAMTHVNDVALSEVKLGQSSQLFAKSQDGLNLHSHVVTPPDFTPTRRYPAVVMIHGGPQGAWEDFWQWRWNAQVLAGAGYVVLMPNPRGSEGFGQKFVDQVSADWGGKAYDDIMRCVDVLVAQPYVDKARVAAVGASYGGYMVNWIAGHSDRFAALVSHAGVFDLRSMYGETEEVWFTRWEFGGDPWNSDLYDKWSPSRYIDKFKTPTLVISNEHDFRVPVGQGMQLFTALQQRKVPSRMLIFPDENHWVIKPLNSRLWYGVVLDWLHRYLGGAAVDPKIIESTGTFAR
ncbi:MAG TPA: S9 family peptidase [Pseudomonadota bacterium]|nr:S9 family peptidase [Pseudomonadota bacterium]